MSGALMEVRELSASYRRDGIGRSREPVKAVDSVSLAIAPGEVLGIVGESGAGKSTLARCMAGLLEPSAGEIAFAGAPLDVARDRSHRRRIQLVFQDPFASLNPRRSVGSVLTELLVVNRLATKGEARARAARLLELVGLPGEALDRRPRAFSGGQRQRIGIARALALEPALLIADEPVSALDVSVQASILKLLKRLQDELRLAVAFISHDLGVVRDFCDRCVVMRHGQVVEEGGVAELFAAPREPYTRELLAAVPRLPALVDDFAPEAKGEEQ